MANTNSNGIVAHTMGDKNGNFTVQYKDKDGKAIKREFTKIVVNVPVTRDAQEKAFAGYTTEIGGKKITGQCAAAAQKFLHSAESIRGEIRSALESGMEMTDETARAMFASYTGPTGRKAKAAPQADLNTLRKLMETGDMAAVAQYLAKQGMAVVGATEEAPEDEDNA